MLQEIDTALEARIRTAQQDGEIGDAQRAGDLACVAGAVLHSLAVRAHIGTPKRRLERLADTVIQLITTTA